MDDQQRLRTLFCLFAGLTEYSGFPDEYRKTDGRKRENFLPWAGIDQQD
jgi:hypothetical protein